MPGRRSLTFLSLLLPVSLVGQAACAPPDALLGSAPEIRLIYPTDETVLVVNEQEGATSCSVDTFVAVDILNFTFVEPNPKGGEVVEGEGHYHVDAGDNSDRPHALFEQTTIGGAPCPVGTDQTLKMRAYLVNAMHEEINDSDEHEDVAEPFLVWPTPGTDDTGDKGDAGK
jgi:hypothetical protein